MDTRHRKHPHLKTYKHKGVTWWLVSFQLQGHQVRKRGFATYEAAELFYFSTRQQIRDGSWVTASANLMASMTLNELYVHYCRRIGQKRGKATIVNGSSSWRHHIGPMLGQKKAKQIGKRTLAVWVDALRDKGLSDNSIKTVKAELSNVLKMAFDYDLISSLPVWPRLYARPQKKVMFKPVEIRQLLEGFKNPQYQLMAYVQYQLALRVNELLGLRPGAFNLDACTVVIDRQMGRHMKNLPWLERLTPTKNKIVRTLPISRELADALKPYVSDRQSDAPLWVSTYLNPVSESAYRAALVGAAQRVGITRPISTHCLRASMLDYLVNHSGLNIHAVAYIGRHSAKVLVSRYSQPDLEQLFATLAGKTGGNVALNCTLAALECEKGA